MKWYLHFTDKMAHSYLGMYACMEKKCFRLESAISQFVRSLYKINVPSHPQDQELTGVQLTKLIVIITAKKNPVIVVLARGGYGVHESRFKTES